MAHKAVHWLLQGSSLDVGTKYILHQQIDLENTTVQRQFTGYYQAVHWMSAYNASETN